MGEGRRTQKKQEEKKTKVKTGGKGNKILIIILVLVIIGAGVLLGVKMLGKNEPANGTANNEQQATPEPEPEPEPKTFAGNDRPIAVMIDNNTNAWPHSGIDKAYIVYEIIVEGGETRLMALFKGQDIDEIGPIRSSRHYFLDYAMENDAIYTHFGWSPQAQSQISSFGINNISGQAYDSGSSRSETSKFWRSPSRNAPHDAYTNTDKLLAIAEDKGYRTTSTKDSVLNYVVDEVLLEEGQVAETVSIPYSGSSNVIRYEYDEETKTYVRYSKGEKQVEAKSKKDITVKNIIITFAENTLLNDGSGKGRQDVKTVGTLDGYYITNGKAIKIECVKSARDEQTVYQDLEGNEIEVNDGNTYIQVCPKNAKVTIK